MSLQEFLVIFTAVIVAFAAIILCLMFFAEQIVRCRAAYLPEPAPDSVDDDPHVLIFEDCMIDAVQVAAVNCGRATTRIYLSDGNELTVQDPDGEVRNLLYDWHLRNCNCRDLRTNIEADPGELMPTLDLPQ